MSIATCHQGGAEPRASCLGSAATSRSGWLWILRTFFIKPGHFRPSFLLQTFSYAPPLGGELPQAVEPNRHETEHDAHQAGQMRCPAFSQDLEAGRAGGADGDGEGPQIQPGK